MSIFTVFSVFSIFYRLVLDIMFSLIPFGIYALIKNKITLLGTLIVFLATSYFSEYAIGIFSVLFSGIMQTLYVPWQLMLFIFPIAVAFIGVCLLIKSKKNLSNEGSSSQTYRILGVVYIVLSLIIFYLMTQMHYSS